MNVRFQQPTTPDETLSPGSGLTSFEICAGAGGQALGLEWAGFEHVALVEIDAWSCTTLRHNRPEWNVIQQDLHTFSGHPYEGVDLLAGGVPCPPFSVAGHKRGHLDERDLFPQALRLVEETAPRAVMLENVRGLLAPEFTGYREEIDAQLRSLGYYPRWKLLNASDYGVPQLRPRAVMVALREEYADRFSWPVPNLAAAKTVGEALKEEMGSWGWPQAAEWAAQAATIAPTLVGGSRKHGGPDLGPTRARKAWAQLGVNGISLADEPPGPDFEGTPRLTVQMTAILQGFPLDWKIMGRKTPAYRQIGNAFPPPVAAAVAGAIRAALVTPGPQPVLQATRILQEVP